MIKFLQTPGKTKKIVLGGMLLLICGAMIVTLIPGGILGDTFGIDTGVASGVVAKVGNQEVSTQEVEQTARRLGRQQFGVNVPNQILPLLRQNAAEQLILQKAMAVEAENMGLRVSDAELLDELQHGPFSTYFFPNGAFIGQAAYADFVTQQFNMGIPQFEQLMKTDMLLNKLRAAVEGPVTISKSDIEEEVKRQETKVKFDYAVISPEDLMKQLHPTDAELKAYFDQSKAKYANAIPEKRQIRYIAVDNAKLQSEVKVSADDIQRYYHDHEDQYRVQDQVNVRHILIKIPLPGADGKVDPKGVEAARQKAEDVLKQLHNGGKFEDLAKKYSDDTDSAKNGGSLGWIGRGRTVPEFEKTAFSLNKGDTSGIVQSSYGFHIIRLDDKQQAHLKPIEEVKSTIEPEVQTQKAAQMADQLATKLSSQAKTQGLDKAAQENNLQVLNSGLVVSTDTLPGVGANPQVMDTIFNAPVKSAPEIAAIPTGFILYQVDEVKPPQAPTFDQIKAKVETDFKTDRANAMLGQKTQELADRARAEHDLKKVAQSLGATFKTSDFVNASGQVPEVGGMSGPMSVAFTLKPGDISGPINAGKNGIVLNMLEKQDPSADEIAKSSEKVRETILTRKRGEMVQLFTANLRQRLEKQGKIKINQAEMQRLSAASPQESGS